MASVTLRQHGRYPVGTVLSAYPASNWPQLPVSGAPQGSAAGTGTVASDGSAVIGSLAAATAYYVHANVAGSDVYTQVRTSPRAEREEDTLVVSAARTVTGNSGEITRLADGKLERVQLDVTAATGTPTLDVVVQDTLDGTNWNTVATFTQKTAVSREVVTAGAHGRRLRVLWTIGGGTPSVTFSVVAVVARA